MAVRVSVLTNDSVGRISDELKNLIGMAHDCGAVVVLSDEEASKHNVEESGSVVFSDDLTADLCVVLGGDETISKALRATAGSGTPVFAVNFGHEGLLSTKYRNDYYSFRHAARVALSRQFEIMDIPAIEYRTTNGDVGSAFRDISIRRGLAVNSSELLTLSCAVSDVEIGRVPCAGIVVATAAGSTGYNLDNGGPVMALGVEGYVVSFVAPRSFASRDLIVAPQDCLTVCSHDASQDPAVVYADGVPVAELGCVETIDITFQRSVSRLAQLPCDNYYERLCDTFGKLAQWYEYER